MKVILISSILFACILCVGCATKQKLKMPCALPSSALAYAPDECGPMLPVNEALANVVQTDP